MNSKGEKMHRIFLLLFSFIFFIFFQKWTKDLKLVYSWQAHDTVVYALAIDKNRLFSSSSEGEIKEWNPNNGEFRQMTILNVSSIYLDELKNSQCIYSYSTQ